MTTPERSVEEIDYEKLAKDLRITSGMIAMGERIVWGSDSGIMDAAADAIEQLTQTLQTERQKRDDAKTEAYKQTHKDFFSMNLIASFLDFVPEEHKDFAKQSYIDAVAEQVRNKHN